MPLLLQLQKLLGKGGGGWETNVFASFHGHFCFGASYSMSKKLLLVVRQILNTGHQKCL